MYKYLKRKNYVDKNKYKNDEKKTSHKNICAVDCDSRYEEREKIVKKDIELIKMDTFTVCSLGKISKNEIFIHFFLSWCDLGYTFL